MSAIEKVTDYAQVATYGTPAVVGDEQVLLAGRIPGLSSLEDALARRLA